VVDDCAERRETSVVIEAALLMREESAQRRRAIAVIGRPVRLEAVNADLLRRVQVPSRFSPQRLGVAVAAFGFSIEEIVASLRSSRIDQLRIDLGRCK
jgi:hypothetical protein